MLKIWLNVGISFTLDYKCVWGFLLLFWGVITYFCFGSMEVGTWRFLLLLWKQSDLHWTLTIRNLHFIGFYKIFTVLLYFISGYSVMYIFLKTGTLPFISSIHALWWENYLNHSCSELFVEQTVSEKNCLCFWTMLKMETTNGNLWKNNSFFNIQVLFENLENRFNEATATIKQSKDTRIQATAESDFESNGLEINLFLTE